ncbi:Smr/MutS family protein [Brachyspira sp. G79]|uniref:Smr/MutS family protein n=1 Tax=Brachyspira sp. G79 TaxID=1358104 RepID=UPI000BBC9267|nr:Smr/MutS family protein [Brachyspira sp. G79]PCG20194.1 hypothetical protein KQ44_09340 [Brachyspira sp. G79]
MLNKYDFHGKSAKETKLELINILETLINNNFSNSIEIVFGRGLHSINNKPILRHVVIRVVKKYKKIGHIKKYFLRKRTLGGSIIVRLYNQ